MSDTDSTRGQGMAWVSGALAILAALAGSSANGPWTGRLFGCAIAFLILGLSFMAVEGRSRWQDKYPRTRIVVRPFDQRMQYQSGGQFGEPFVELTARLHVTNRSHGRPIRFLTGRLRSALLDGRRPVMHYASDDDSLVHPYDTLHTMGLPNLAPTPFQETGDIAPGATEELVATFAVRPLPSPYGGFIQPRRVRAAIVLTDQHGRNHGVDQVTFTC